MTVKEAVEILNRARHRDRDSWYSWGDPDGPYGVVVENQEELPGHALSDFEAVAIAEKYLRLWGISALASDAIRV